MEFDIHDNGLPYVEFDGHRRVLACLKPTRTYDERPHFAASNAVLPRSQWKEFLDNEDDLPILDQDGHGSCVGHGSCTAFQHAWFQGGADKKRFSPCFLYGLINGGRDGGAVVGDAMDALEKTGICLETTIPEGNIIFERQFPKAAFDEAKRFKLAQAYRVRNFDEIVTAVLLGYAVSIGIEIGNAFQPSSDGVLPDQRGGGGGHCLCLRRGLMNKNGRWYVRGQNSWGTNWGDKGRFWMPESYFRGADDHFVPQVSVQDPQEPNDPPVAKATADVAPPVKGKNKDKSH